MLSLRWSRTTGGLLLRGYGVKTVRTRAFNQTGPGQAPEFVVSDFARQIALIEAGRSEPVIRVGNLEARRDFSDVRDLAAAIGTCWSGACRAKPTMVCSGRALSVREILDMLLALAKRPIEYCADPPYASPWTYRCW